MDYTISAVSQLSDHLRSLRKARGLTQTALGELLGVKQARVADIERDPSVVSVEQLHKLLAILGVQLVLHDTGSGLNQPAAARRRPNKGSW
jgi:HTH-type transcriptional regulator/antitoxin HipB